MQLLASEVSAEYYTHPPAIVSLLMTLHKHTQGRFNNHTPCSLYRIMFTAISVVDEIKMGNIVPRARIEPTSPAFRATVVTNTPHRLA